MCSTTRALQRAPGEYAFRQLNASELSLVLQNGVHKQVNKKVNNLVLSRKFMKKMYEQKLNGGTLFKKKNPFISINAHLSHLIKV